MARDSDLAQLHDRQAWAPHEQKVLAGLDFSGSRICYDFSEFRISTCNFANCSLVGSNFKNAKISQCNMSGSDWAGCDFEHAYFNGGNLSDISNAHKALNLTTATADGHSTGFESAIRPWYVRCDWELLGALGRLPLFGISATALVAMPIYFYFLALYNHNLRIAKRALAPLQSVSPDTAAAVISKLTEIPIPSMSLLALTSALFLALGAALYGYACPPLPKQFSLSQWRFQLERAVIPYWSQAWSRQTVRMICAICYLIGGIAGGIVLGFKLYRTVVYIIADAQ